MSSDPLVDMVGLLRPRAALSAAVRTPPSFGLVLNGWSLVDVPGHGSLPLNAGDLVFSRDTDLPAPALTARMFRGHFVFDPAQAPLLARLVQPVVHVPRCDPAAAHVGRLADLIADELTNDIPGQSAVLDRLAELLFVETVRFRLAHPGPPGLVTGLADAWIAPALRAFHLDVSHRWTVAELAGLSGLRRAAFAQRFLQKVGVPPLQYVLEWRLALARDLLSRQRLGPSEVAERLGYQSSTAFNAAFSRATGLSPGAFANPSGV